MEIQPEISTMKSPSLFVVAHAACTVRVTCGVLSELRRVEPRPGGGFSFVTPLAPHDPQELRLDAGLYHVASTEGVSCHVVDGSCSVVLAFGGEDPWPIPPPFGTAGEYIDVATAYVRAM
jgi:hypothetical protein